ncbi:metal-dependent hydrolase [Zobellella denitrificans]|uniref:DNAse n=1 Tax=Zobellella denitrificans TaxID=347534 RepID=A0A231N159_9GAMM|nr:TatD family hydrolase [Zobellella denitrificans]ATG73966.1 DNAse [Zobellella denitrificans]OXS16221.1 metal-dependent hydrolase [Zobellella denitrificans]
MLVDSHCHLDKLDYGNKHANMAEAIDKAARRGVDHMLCIGVGLSSFPAMLEAIAPFPQVFASCGVHPLHQQDEQNDPALLRRLAAHPAVVAVGETGLDYFYAPETAALQRQAFEQHVEVAVDLGKPLVIHTRSAQQDTLDILRQGGADKVGGVLHCFTESLEMAEAAMELGFYISISGIVTFRSADALREVVKALPLERLLLETDSPWLAPVPFRGEENEPAYTRTVAEFVAGLKGESLERVARQTTTNFFELFKLARPVPPST